MIAAFGAQRGRTELFAPEPVLGITLILLALDVLLGGLFFSADPVLFQHFFWFYSHPAVYIFPLLYLIH